MENKKIPVSPATSSFLYATFPLKGSSVEKFPMKEDTATITHLPA
jgi:hypothetical protein